MSGMLRKDFYLIKEYRKVVLVMIVFAALFCIRQKSGGSAFAMGYTTLMMSMGVTTVITYDQENKGMVFLLTLPIDRRSYVREKYIFGLLMGGSGWLGGAVMVIAAGALRGQNPLSKEILAMLLGFLAFLLICQSVMIPVQLKFGAEKGRYIIILVMVVMMLLGMGGASLIIENNLLTSELVSGVLKSGALPAAGAALILAVYGGSFCASLHILDKKEF